MVAAAVILQVGKVELRDVWSSRGVPPSVLKVAKLARPYIADRYEKNPAPIVNLEVNYIELDRHRMFGCSVEVAYWHRSWQDAWAIEELLKWEGREDEIRRDQYYGEFYRPAGQELDFAQQRSEANFRHAANSQTALESSRKDQHNPSTTIVSRSDEVSPVFHSPAGGRSVDSRVNDLARGQDVFVLEQLPSGPPTDIPR